MAPSTQASGDPVKTKRKRLKSQQRASRKKKEAAAALAEEEQATEPDPSEGLHLQCQCCQLQFTSLEHLQRHRQGKRHSRRKHQKRILGLLEQEDLPGSMDATSKEALAVRLARKESAASVAPLTDDTLPDCLTRRVTGKIRHLVHYACSLCDVTLTSLVTAQKHLQSARHAASSQGLPPPERRQRPAVRHAAAAASTWFW